MQWLQGRTPPEHFPQGRTSCPRLGAMESSLSWNIRRNVYGKASYYMRCLGAFGEVEGPGVYVATCYVRTLIKKIMKRKQAVEEGTRQQLARMAGLHNNAPADPIIEDQTMRNLMLGRSSRSQLRNRIVVALRSAVSGEIMKYDEVFTFALVGDVISKANGVRRRRGEGRAENDNEFRLVDDSLSRRRVVDLLSDRQMVLELYVLVLPRPTVIVPEG